MIKKIGFTFGLANAGDYDSGIDSYDEAVPQRGNEFGAVHRLL